METFLEEETTVELCQWDTPELQTLGSVMDTTCIKSPYSSHKLLVVFCSVNKKSPGPTQILSRGCGEKLGEGLGAKLRHGPEMVDTVCTLPIFLYGCEIKSGRGLETSAQHLLVLLY